MGPHLLHKMDLRKTA